MLEFIGTKEENAPTGYMHIRSGSLEEAAHSEGTIYIATSCCAERTKALVVQFLYRFKVVE